MTHEDVRRSTSRARRRQKAEGSEVKAGRQAGCEVNDEEKVKSFGGEVSEKTKEKLAEAETKEEFKTEATHLRKKFKTDATDLREKFRTEATELKKTESLSTAENAVMAIVANAWSLQIAEVKLEQR
jgi:hypothetical protein